MKKSAVWWFEVGFTVLFMIIGFQAWKTASKNLRSVELRTEDRP